MRSWPLLKQEVVEFFEDLKRQEDRLTDWKLKFFSRKYMKYGLAGYCNRKNGTLDITNELDVFIKEARRTHIKPGRIRDGDFDLAEHIEYKKLVLHEATHVLESGFHDASFWFKYEKMLDKYLGIKLNSVEKKDKSSCLAKIRAVRMCDKLSPARRRNGL